MQTFKQNISSIKARISQYLDQNNISKYNFYQTSGISRGTLDNESGLTEENIAKFLAYEPKINTEWLLTGKGEMIREAGIFVKEPELTKSKNEIPLIPIDAIAGFNGNSVQVLEKDIEHYFSLPVLREKPDFVIRIKGDSMVPTYEDAAFLFCKKIEAMGIDWETPYLIAVHHAPMIKRLLPAQNPENFLCRSDNPIHRDFEIKKKDITAIYKILAYLRLE